MANRRSKRHFRRRKRRRRDRTSSPLADKPFRTLQNPLAPVEVLSPEQINRIHDTSMRILHEIGLDFLDEEVLDVWEQAGARVDRDAQHVWLDPDLVMKNVSKAPSQFTLQARNPKHNLTVGTNNINFAPVAAAPYFSDLDNGRRPGSLDDFRKMTMLTQMCGPLHIIEGLLVEPQDIEVPIRHLEKGLIQFTLTDKAQTTAAHGRVIAQDFIDMAAIVFGGLENIHAEPALLSNINVNSPLRYDERMLGAMVVYARNNQPVIVTPFILAGAMSPVTMAAAIAQQNAEALAGIALIQLINPGVPAVYGGFTTNIDMRTGNPAFGTPEGSIALLSGAQLARHYGIPYRGSGGLNNAKSPDAQAAYETQMTLWPAVLGHANVILHSAGWLEAGLVCSMEKFILDVEGVAMIHHFLHGLQINDDSLAVESIAAVGPGGHHFDTKHTLDRYQTSFYNPIVSNRDNFGTWTKNGRKDAAQQANHIAKQLLKNYDKPEIDPNVEVQLKKFVEQRKQEFNAA